MNTNFWGLGLLLLAGGMNGSFTLPMKFTRRWAWENTWLVYTIFALGLFPPLLTLATVPAIRAVYAKAGAGPVAMVALFGAGWGISQIFLAWRSRGAVLLSHSPSSSGLPRRLGA